uniref:CSON014412 protein n=1 Tax=Culicoides sonorensis TaxID=179676 RepID=A0A336LUY6_CULSO
MDRAVNFNYPLTPESGYYASSPDSSMAMSPEYSGNQNLTGYYDNSQNTYLPGVQLVAIKTPQTFFRFRYESEMHGTHGSLMGRDSTRESKTFPTIQVKGLNQFSHGNPVIRVRCTLHQAEKQNQDGGVPHSHKLVIKNGDQEKYDPHFVEATPQNGYKVEFKGMGIIHTAKKDIVSELGKKLIRLKEFEYQRDLTALEKEKENNKIRNMNVKSMNLNQVCLCFEAFWYDQNMNQWCKICPSIYSEPINNIKSALTGELKICSYSTCVSSVTGGQEVYLLVEKVNRGDIKVRFFDNQGWQDFARIETVHHQYAIVLRTPAYHNQKIIKPVQVLMQLYRTKDGCMSEPREFTYKPSDNIINGGSNKRKMRRVNEEDSIIIPTTVSESIVVSSTTSNDMDFDISHIDFTEFNLNAPLSPEESEKVDEILSELVQSSSQVEFDSVGASSDEVSDKKKLKFVYHLHGLLIKFIKTDNEKAYFSVISSIKKHNLLKDILNIRLDGTTILHLACVFGRHNFLSRVLDNQTDLTVADQFGNTPIHTCIEEDRPTCLKALLHGSHKTRSFLEQKNYDGFTALHLAIKNNSLLMAKMLFEKGASLFAKSLDIIKFILKNTGTQLLNKLNGSEKTPLDVLYENTSSEDFSTTEKEIAQILLANGGWSIYINGNENSENNLDDDEIDDQWDENIRKNLTANCDEVDSYRNYISDDTLKILNGIKDDETDNAISSLKVLSLNDDTLKEAENPIKFDTQAKDQLSTILNGSESWRQCAMLLGLENLSDIWSRQENPSECLLAYIEGCKFEFQSVIDTFESLDLRDAISVLDGMLARQLK